MERERTRFKADRFGCECRHLLDRTCANFVREHVYFRENHDENHVPESRFGMDGVGWGVLR